MKKVFIILLFLSFLVLSLFNLHAEEIKEVTAGGGTYRFVERTNEETLQYGINYIRDIAESKSVNMIGSTNTFDPQVVNILEVPSSKAIKVVNWTYSTKANWSKQTIRSMARDFERNNPGWIVLGGINGDFFDINGNGALPYQTTSAAMNNGDLVRSQGNSSSTHQQIGFLNNGEKKSMVGGEKYEITPDHYLQILNEKGEIVKEYVINKLNEAPTGDEISLYFSYTYFDESSNRVINEAHVKENSFSVTKVIRGYANGDSAFFGKGEIDTINTEEKLVNGGFSIVTTNENVKKDLKLGTLIRVQHKVVGAYEKCENITGCGVTLVKDGEAVENVDGMSNYRHPRTIIGRKADGTILMITIDGRQQVKNMYGMSYEELSATLLYYDCIEGYNLDGGGSTTMITRNAEGDFDVMNSPSDGNERSDSNAILIVAPGINLSINKATDTTVNFSYNSNLKGIEIKNLKVTLQNDHDTLTRTITEDLYTWEDLEPNTTYSLSYSYDVVYEGTTIHNEPPAKSFKTGNPKLNVPFAKMYKYFDKYIVLFDIDDEYNTLVSMLLKYGKKIKVLQTTDRSAIIDVSELGDEKLYLELTYNVSATPSSMESITYPVVDCSYEEDHKIDYEDEFLKLTITNYCANFVSGSYILKDNAQIDDVTFKIDKNELLYTYKINGAVSTKTIKPLSNMVIELNTICEEEDTLLIWEYDLSKISNLYAAYLRFNDTSIEDLSLVQKIAYIAKAKISDNVYVDLLFIDGDRLKTVSYKLIIGGSNNYELQLNDLNPPVITPVDPIPEKTKKKCGKKSAELIISLISISTLLSFILRRKH